tara:strand:+ start:408 stop:587 length:180 start_codon:yes stop_codon:yes gene_type:complete
MSHASNEIETMHTYIQELEVMIARNNQKISELIAANKKLIRSNATFKANATRRKKALQK